MSGSKAWSNNVMRIAPIAVAALALVGASMVAPASASAKKARKFSVEFTSVANSCKDTGMSLNKSTVEITPGTKRKITVSVPMVPIMKGTTKRGGKFVARAKRGKTGIAGLDGKFSISGTIADDGGIELVFIAEYYKGKTPLCTQSWKGTGSKS